MLLEALIAFLIAALALSGLYEAATTALAGTEIAAGYDQAMSRARSRLDTVCHGATLTAGQSAGDDGGGYHWQVRVALAQTAFDALGQAGGPDAARRVGLYDVTVEVFWRRGHARRAVQLASEAVGPAASP